MKPASVEILLESFTSQAAGSESGAYRLPKWEYPDYLVLRTDQSLQTASCFLYNFEYNIFVTVS